jgi:hypothetical protein
MQTRIKRANVSRQRPTFDLQSVCRVGRFTGRPSLTAFFIARCTTEHIKRLGDSVQAGVARFHSEESQIPSWDWF